MGRRRGVGRPNKSGLLHANHDGLRRFRIGGFTFDCAVFAIRRLRIPSIHAVIIGFVTCAECGSQNAPLESYVDQFRGRSW
eukprot:9545517-Alexandrium_andersonii.AAC.1